MTILNPLDSRYRQRVSPITKCLGSDAYKKFLVLVEIEWLLYFIKHLSAVKPSYKDAAKLLANINSVELAEQVDLQRIKELENQLGHDIKAVQYYVKELIRAKLAKETEYTQNLICELVHIGCTSEDITNVAYAIGVGRAKKAIICRLKSILIVLEGHIQTYAQTPMLAFTHGQPASPTTVGKEFAVYYERIKSELDSLNNLPIKAKFAGATGNHNALAVIDDLEPHEITNRFVELVGYLYDVPLKPSSVVTQVESHDSIAAILHNIIRINNILTDLACDMWQYIGKSYFKLKVDRVGSSTMPHKINPIEFENAEGNFGLSNSMLSFMSDKITISRMQRDLSGSTVKRNLGTALGYSFIAYESILSGISKIEANKEQIQSDLFNHAEVIGEAIQTFLRVSPDVMANINQEFKVDFGPYEIMREMPHQVIEYLNKNKIFNMDADKYLGMAPAIAKDSLLSK